MDIRAIAFDVNGTLVEIWTEDESEQVFRAAGHFLTYQGIDLRREQVRDLYLQAMKAQRKSSTELYPEFDAVAIWRTILDENATDFTRTLAAEKLAQLPLTLAELTRGVARRQLRLYPYVRQVLDALSMRYALALVTDAQSAWARAELQQVGLLEYFDPIVVSGDYGYRKPDKRLFQQALDEMGVDAKHTLYVGNDMHRDVYGAREIGMKTVMFDSGQGTKEHLDCVPDFTITDHRELLDILGIGRAAPA